MINYPTNLPTDALLTLADKLRGKTKDWPVAILAGWNLLGYALSQMPISSPEHILDTYNQADSITINTEEEAATFLENNFLVNQDEVDGKKPIEMSGIVWLVLIKIITKFIINVL